MQDSRQMHLDMHKKLSDEIKVQNNINEELFNKNSKNVRANTEKLADHTKELEAFNNFQQTTSRNIDRIEQKI